LAFDTFACSGNDKSSIFELLFIHPFTWLALQAQKSGISKKLKLTPRFADRGTLRLEGDAGPSEADGELILDFS
jgi:hypothetical protein